MSTLVIVEHDNQRLHPHTRALLGAASRLAGEVDVLVIGHSCSTVAEEAATLEGVTRVRWVDAVHYSDLLAENLAMVVAQMAAAYRHVLLPATAFGKNLAPRVAAMLDVAQVSDIVGIQDAEHFVRPIYAGSLLETVRSREPVGVMTVRCSAFMPVGQSANAAPIVPFSAGPDMGVVRLLQRVRIDATHPQLANARVVVAGGRGLGSAEAFHRLLDPLAACFGAAIAATRAAVDSNYVGNDCQVGQTGKIVAPDIYIAVGISGAAQHIAGIRGAKLVVAINKDPEAPLIRLADLALVGDLHEVVPQLTEMLQR
jgi:electron transfer flavoprotein alpha subunit